jgi:hypothetical protein
MKTPVDGGKLMPLVVTLTFWSTDERLPPKDDYYYVKFDNFLTEAYWNGNRWFDACGRYLPDFAQTFFTHWAVEPAEEKLSNLVYPLLPPPAAENN